MFQEKDALGILFLIFYLEKRLKTTKKVVANENTSHLSLRYFNCSIR